MNLRPGIVLLDLRQYREHRRVRELLITAIDGDNVGVHTLSGDKAAKVVSARYFGQHDDWSLQGHWAVDTRTTIPPITPPLDEYAVNRLEYRRTALKLTSTARVEFSLVPSLEPLKWEAKDEAFRILTGPAPTPGGMSSNVRFLDFRYVNDGGLRRLIYRRRGQQWLLVRTLIAPEWIAARRIMI